MPREEEEGEEDEEEEEEAEDEDEEEVKTRPTPPAPAFKCLMAENGGERWGVGYSFSSGLRWSRFG